MPPTDTTIKFKATLHKPVENSSEGWTFLRLPQDASDKLPTRSMVSVEGTINNSPFTATLQPDGKGGHWLKVSKNLCKSSKTKAGDQLTLEIAPCEVEPEPEVPDDLQQALNDHPDAQPAWHKTTAIARRDWISWITSGKKAETRTKRIETAMDMMSKGKKRPCCFDRSGMYSNTLNCPVAADVIE
ncbi:MAG: YdeI/OmpD-associated family protein [Fimbriimonadaceae bacterium]